MPTRRFRSAVLALLLAGACYGPDLEGPPPDDGTIVRLEHDTALVLLALDAQLGATHTDSAGADVPGALHWTSRDLKIATVDKDGVVHGVATGKTWIIVSDSRHADSLVLSVVVTFYSVSAGTDVTCGVSSAGGSGLCWGWNAVGSVGVGMASDTSAPRVVAGNHVFSDVTMGAGSGCGLVGPALQCWGYNGVGQLGDGTAANRFEPVAVADTLSFIRVTLGSGATSCGWDSQDRLLCWGWNGHGQLLAGGPGPNSRRPLALQTPAPLTSITTGGGHVCGLTASGAAWCWGRNDRGQLGLGDTDPRYDPQLVGGVPAFVSIVAGLTHTCARTAAGEVWCWGDNALGQVGAAGPTGFTSTAVPAAPGITFDDIHTTWNHTCGISSSAAVLCWGDNAKGQLGRGSAGAPSSTPQAVTSTLRFRSVSAGVNHTCAVTENNIAWCWGANATGALGDGTRVDRSLPVKVQFQP